MPDEPMVEKDMISYVKSFVHRLVNDNLIHKDALEELKIYPAIYPYTICNVEKFVLGSKSIHPKRLIEFLLSAYMANSGLRLG